MDYDTLNSLNSALSYVQDDEAKMKVLAEYGFVQNN